MARNWSKLLSRSTTVEGPAPGRTDRLPTDGATGVRSRGTGIDRRSSLPDETRVRVRGVIRSDVVHLLPPYGTAYGLFDEETFGYDCVLASDIYRLTDWIGEYVEASGPLISSGHEGLPRMNVDHLQLLAAKWMR